MPFGRFLRSVKNLHFAHACSGKHFQLLLNWNFLPRFDDKPGKFKQKARRSIVRYSFQQPGHDLPERHFWYAATKHFQFAGKEKLLRFQVGLGKRNLTLSSKNLVELRSKWGKFGVGKHVGQAGKFFDWGGLGSSCGFHCWKILVQNYLRRRERRKKSNSISGRYSSKEPSMPPKTWNVCSISRCRRRKAML